MKLSSMKMQDEKVWVDKLKPRIRYSPLNEYWILYFNDIFILGRDTLEELWEGWLELESHVRCEMFLRGKNTIPPNYFDNVWIG